MNPLNLFENGARHMMFALRTLSRHRGAYVASIGILALGIGMSVAMFSLVDAVLVRPLPFPVEHLIEVLGQTIRLNGQGHTVIGVMAPGVDFPRGAGLWIPLGIDRRVVERRTATFLQAIARVKRGYSRASVTAEVNALFARLAAEHPDAYSRSQRGVMMPITEYWTGSARLHLWIMLGASLLLLVAATISAGNLFLSRALSRRQEIATRSALGARPAQILLQFAAEGIVAGAIAASVGLLSAQLIIRFLVKWTPADIPRLSQAALQIHSL